MAYNEQDDIEEIRVQNSFVIFLISISKLGLSDEATSMLRNPKAGELYYFFMRQRRLQRPLGILVL